MNNIISIKEFIKTEEGSFTIEMSKFISASAETVYGILSDKAGLEQFMECKIEGELKTGAPIKFIWEQYEVDDDDCSGVNGGEIVNMIPNKLLSFTWGDPNPARNLPLGSTLVEFKITPEADGCRVTICHYDLPSEKEADNHTGGWSKFLEQNTGTWSSR